MSTRTVELEVPGPQVVPEPRGGRRLPQASVFVGGVSLLAVMTVIHVQQGHIDLGLADVLRAVFTPTEGLQDSIIRHVRLPRVTSGILVGGALGVSGCLFQTITRNPLAAPATLGVNAGAFFAIVLAAAFFPGALGLSPAGIAFIGGAGAALLVYAIAASVHITPVRLVLAGVAVTLAASALTAGVQIFFENETAGLFFWGQGTLIQNDWSGAQYMAPRLLLGVVAAIGMGHHLDVFSLGDDVASALGQRINRVRLGAGVIAVFLAAVAVSVTGPIGFVGLVAPHLVRLAGVQRHRAVLVGAAIWGALMVVTADVAARVLVSSLREVPVGVVTAFIGAPFLVWLMRRTDHESADAEQGGGSLALPESAGQHYRLKLTIMVGLLCGVLATGLAIGAVRVDIADLWQVLAGGGSDFARQVVLDLRMPRLLVAMLSGAALAVSGAIIQGVIRNPLAAPSIVGVVSGAGLGALITLLALPQVPPSFMPLAAFVGGVTAFGVVYLASWRQGIQPARLALIGIAVSAFCLSVINMLVAMSEMRVAQALAFLAGSTYARSWDQVWALVGWPLILIPLAWLGGRQLDLMALGERAPVALGLHLERARLVLLGIAVALASAAVAAVGTVGFVGLMGPHAARMLVGGKMRRVIPAAALLGALLVAGADVVGRVVLMPREVPAGLVTALIGTPYFVFLMWRSRPGAPGQ